MTRFEASNLQQVLCPLIDSVVLVRESARTTGRLVDDTTFAGIVGLVFSKIGVSDTATPDEALAAVMDASAYAQVGSVMLLIGLVEELISLTGRSDLDLLREASRRVSGPGGGDTHG